LLPTPLSKEIKVYYSFVSDPLRPPQPSAWKADTLPIELLPPLPGVKRASLPPNRLSTAVDVQGVRLLWPPAVCRQICPLHTRQSLIALFSDGDEALKLWAFGPLFLSSACFRKHS